MGFGDMEVGVVQPWVDMQGSSFSCHSIVSWKNWSALTATLHDQSASVWGGGTGFYFSAYKSNL